MKPLKRLTLLSGVFFVGLALILFAVFNYNSESEDILREKQEYLKTVNQFKIEQIMQWRKERFSTAKFFPTVGKFIKSTAELIENRSSVEPKKYFNSVLQPFKTNHYYENIFITDVSGSVLYSLDSNYTLADEVVRSGISSAIQMDSVIFSDFYFHKIDKVIYFDLISPLKDNDGKIPGAIVQRVNPVYNFYPIISRWPSESKTAESLIFKIKNDSVVFITDLRHKKNPELTFSISLNDTDVIAVKGATGKEGILHGIDYRGETVIADLKNIPGTDWYIVSKIDKDEINQNVLLRIELLLLLIAVLLAAMVLGYLYVYKSKLSKEFQVLFKKEKELSEIQKEFRTALYSIGDAVITTDSTGRIKYMNIIAEELTGWTENEAKGNQLDKVFNILNEDSRQKIENPAQKVLKIGTIVSLANHTLLVTKSGKELPIADSGSPIKDDKGNITGVVLVFRDQTGERNKEKQLLENIEKYKSIFNSSLDVIVFTHLNTGKLIEMNEAFTKVFGYDRDEVIGKLTTEIQIWADPADRDKFVQKLKSSGTVRDLEVMGKRKDGSYFYGLISANIITINDDQFIYTTVRNISDRKEAEQAIQRFKFVSDFAPLAIFWLNENAGFDYVNEQACKSLGYTRDELMNLTLFDIDPIYPRESWNKRWKNSLHNQIETELIETIHQRKDGSSFPVEVVVQNLKFNNTVLHVSFVQDITGRKNAETELKFNEERYKKLFDHSPVGILLEDEEGIIQVVNDAHCRITGYSMQELVGRNIKIISPPSLHYVVEENIKKILSGKILNHSVETIRKDGTKTIVQLTETKIALDNDRYGILCISYDISEIISAQSELKKLSRAVEQSPATIMITDTDGRLEYVNPKFTEVTGYTFDEVRGLNPRFLNSGMKQKNEYAVLWKTILSGKEWRGEFYNRKKNGEYFWESATISPITNDSGKITNFIGIKEDITVQKLMNEELVLAKNKAEEMNRIKSYFYANMSHELRTPFVGILGYSQLLSETLHDEDQRYMAKQILTSSRRLTDTLNKVLDVTKLEFDKITPALEEINLLVLIQDLKSLFDAASKQKNTEIKIEYDYESHSIITDKKLLREILTNLISNAVKFTSNGRIILSVQNNSDNSADYLNISVADTGLGIPKDKQQIIWEEFRQASEGLSRSFEGTGLGLTITKKYCEILGGSISLVSDVGKGAVFTLKLPVLKKISGAVETVEKEIITVNDLPANNVTKNPGILYVEDDTVAQEFVTLVLSRMNYTLEISGDADSALQLVKDKIYDLLLIDINLGHGIDGVQLTQSIRQIPAYKNVPIIAVTAYASEEDKNEFLSKGFSHYLSKPFSIDELKTTLKSALK